MENKKSQWKKDAWKFALMAVLLGVAWHLWQRNLASPIRDALRINHSASVEAQR